MFSHSTNIPLRSELLRELGLFLILSISILGREIWPALLSILLTSTRKLYCPWLVCFSQPCRHCFRTEYPKTNASGLRTPDYPHLGSCGKRTYPPVFLHGVVATTHDGLRLSCGLFLLLRSRWICRCNPRTTNTSLFYGHFSIIYSRLFELGVALHDYCSNVSLGQPYLAYAI